MANAVDELWAQYDTDGNGHLDKTETMRLVKGLMTSLNISSDFSEKDFDLCFSEFDIENTGQITKENMVNYIKKLVGF